MHVGMRVMKMQLNGLIKGDARRASLRAEIR